MGNDRDYTGAISVSNHQCQHSGPAWHSTAIASESVSSYEVGANAPGIAATYTATPQQISDFVDRYGFIQSAMGPEDEISPFYRHLQSGLATVRPPSQPPTRFPVAPSQDSSGNPFGAGIDNWGAAYIRGNAASTPAATTAINGDAGAGNVGQSKASVFASGATPIPYLPQAPQNAPRGLPGLMAAVTGMDSSQPEPQPGGLLGLMMDYMRNR